MLYLAVSRHLVRGDILPRKTLNYSVTRRQETTSKQELSNLPDEGTRITSRGLPRTCGYRATILLITQRADTLQWLDLPQDLGRNVSALCKNELVGLYVGYTIVRQH